MTTSISSAAPGLGGTSGLADLYTSATKSLLAQNPGIKTIDAQISRDNARLSGIGKLALALDAFRTSAGKLGGDKLDAAASASGKAVTAQLTDSKATAGTHVVDVKQLAQGQQLATKALPDKGAALGGGATTLIRIDMGTGSGATSTTLKIDGSNNTLDGIAKAMRDAGLDATVVQDGKGYSLSLTGKSGAANTMRIGVSGDPVLQGLFSYGPGVNSAMTQKAAARDAQVVVDGKAITASANKLEAALPGVSLTLNEVGKSEVKVARDPSAITANVKDVVAAFNTMNTRLGDLKTGDTANDILLRQVQAQVGQVIDGADQKALADVGITRKNGALVLDEARLKAAVAADPDKVTQLFSKSGTGLADQFTSRIDQQMRKGGLLTDQAAALQGEVDKLTAKKTQMTDIVNQQASMLAQQYALIGSGGNALYGLGGATRPMSLFDFMA
ncbi:flagellar filament capping protein FliD [uncultured Massilia sp.]|uniref:flagellar filament capping protein FliD n=1 Tax=uncultured Massilia sp. TaxID=169973 RepID=UPI0025F5DC3F|nr:flagellar filament capping protein FliD [uncultured Massilia sp.]